MMCDVVSMSSSDEEEQANELLVLQSVYGDNVLVGDSVTDNDGAALSAFSVDVEVALQTRVSLQVELGDHEPPVSEASSKAVAGSTSFVRDPRELVNAQTEAAAGVQAVLPTRSKSGRSLVATARFLPPLHLALVLPRDYPSSSPPRFTLSALWLDVEQLSLCAKALDKLWEDMAGNGVVFSWVEWLKHEAMALLGLDGNGYDGSDLEGGAPCLTLRPHGVKSAPAAENIDGCGGGSGSNGGSLDDVRVVAECESPNEALVAILQYAFEEEQRAFALEVHTCPICMDEVPGMACVAGVAAGCEHAVCRQCLRAMIETAVDSATIDGIRCPMPECRSELPAALIAQLVPSETQCKWEGLRKEQLLAALPGLCYCPRCDPASAQYRHSGRPLLKGTLCKFWEAGACAAGSRCKFAHGESELVLPPQAVPCLPVDDSDLCICPECDFNFCAACYDPYHPGSECASLEARTAYLAARAARMVGQAASSSSHSSSRAAVHAKLAELKTLEVIKRTAKQCPSCRAAIERTEGCNHMQCRFCAAHFCWSCGQIIGSANPYDHFRSGGCVVFPTEGAPRRGGAGPLRLTAAQRREDRLARQLLNQQRGGQNLERLQHQLALRGKRCPTCGAVNHKEDNSNHIRCHHCRGSFCFLCRADLRRGMRGHFTSTHPQHSPLDEGGIAEALADLDLAVDVI